MARPLTRRSSSSRPRRSSLPLAAAVVGLLLSGCSTASSDGAATATPTTASPTRPAPSATTGVADGTAPVPATLFGMQPASLGPSATAASLGAVDPRRGIGTVFILANGGEWTDVQPTADQPPDTRALESAVDVARSRGLTDVHVILTGTPQWAAADAPVAGEPTPGYSSPPRDIAAWEGYVRAVATALKGRATSYQVWSEANLRTRWHGTPEQLAQLTRSARDVIAQVDPAAPVVAASTTVRLGDLDRWYRPFLAALRAQGWPVDAFSAHFYPPGDGTPVTRQELIRSVQDALAAEGAPALPLWDGEINYGVAGPTAASPHRDLDNATGAGYVARTYLDALRLGISRVYWSAWTPKNSVYGVTMWPGSVGAKAQRTTHDWLVGRYWKGCEEGPGDLVTCRVTSSTSPTSAPATIVWSEGASTTVEVPAGARRVQSATGAQSRVRPGDTVDVGGSPVWIGP